MIGQTISHYRILEKLGEGGMGVVYKAEDVKLHRPVALKILPPRVFNTEEDRTRFVREAQAAASLNHPNIATIYEFDEAADPLTGGTLAFIVMEYVDGDTLRQKINIRPLQVNEIVKIAIGVSKGLAEAHGQGIIHRDIKSDNIMIARAGGVKILDFGLAEVAGNTRVTRAGMAVGTVAYMSPEQARGEKSDHRTDIWSLGVVLYEMITGQLPFDADHEQAVIYSILNEEPEPVATLRTDTPPTLQAITKKAMSKTVGDRYQSTQEILAEFHAMDKESGSVGERVVRSWPARLRLFAGLVVTLTLILGFALYFLHYSKPEPAYSSIAVLPLANYSEAPDEEYFADGMTEALITELAQVSTLRVISRTSVIRYKTVSATLPEIARDLNVDVVIEGSVSRVGDRVRITAQLLHAPTDQNLWAKSYERSMEDILTLQSEVARAIIGEIRLELTPREEELLADSRTVDPETYSAYLKGRYHYNKYTEKDINAAIGFYKQAISRDPQFSLAYAGLAHSYSALRSFFLPPREVMPEAKAAALKAVELDGNLAEAHVALASVLLFYDWEWDNAEGEFKSAIELNPNLAAAHKYYAWCLSAMGRHPDAIAHMERALLLDPVSPLTLAEAAWTFYMAREYSRGIEVGRKAVELAPDFWFGYTILGLALEKTGRFTESIAMLRRADQLGSSTSTLEFLAGAYAASGQIEKAREVLKRLTDLSASQYVCPYEIATVYAELGDSDRTLEWLEKGYAERADCMPWVNSDPKLESLHLLPSFQALMNRMKFPGERVKP